MKVLMLDDLIRERLKKLEALKAKGVNPYPARMRRSLTIGEAQKKFSALAKSKKTIALAGRIWSIRDQGGVLFLDLKDETGGIQVVANKSMCEDFEFLKSVLDRGDFASVSGTLFVTKRGERSIEAKELAIIAKSLRPLPTEWYGLEETETRLRQRYLDMLLNPEAKKLFEKKATFWESFREFLGKEGFLEVETPVLEEVPGGADAEPFRTHHNALGVDFYLRISLELSLKKLLVGGFEKVFEIGRIFRNEGIDKEHLQDYTQLEFYWAYRDYRDLTVLLEKMYKAVIKKTCGGLTTTYEGKKINWGKKWGTVDFVEVFRDATKIDPLTASRDELARKAETLGAVPDRSFGRGRLIDLIFKKAVRSTLVQPVFLLDPPVEMEPLAKRKEDDPRRVERLQIVAGGTELGKGFSELNDPVDQRKRLEEQMRLREAGDREAQRMNEEFVEALEYGMPPAAGFGVSERLFAVLMDKPVRETVIFPLMRPERK